MDNFWDDFVDTFGDTFGDNFRDNLNENLLAHHYWNRKKSNQTVLWTHLRATS